MVVEGGGMGAVLHTEQPLSQQLQVGGDRLLLQNTCTHSCRSSWR